MNGRKVVEIPTNLKLLPGTYTSEVYIGWPPGTSKGTYEVLVTVSAGGQFARKTTGFRVEPPLKLPSVAPADAPAQQPVVEPRREQLKEQPKPLRPQPRGLERPNSTSPMPEEAQP